MQCNAVCVCVCVCMCVCVCVCVCVRVRVRRSLYSSMVNVTGFEEYLWRLDHRPAFQFYKRQLQLLQWQRRQSETSHWCGTGHGGTQGGRGVRV